jgi:hypothetical protein
MRAALALVLLIILFNWKLVLSDQYTWLDSPDIANMEVPRLQFQASEWKAGRIPLWDPYHWSGQPALGQMTGAAAPLNLPLFATPFRDGKLRQKYLHWYYVYLHALAALAAFALCRSLSVSSMASILGGLLYSMGGFVGTSDWPALLNAAVYAPLVLLFLLKAGRGEKPLASAVLSGTFLGLAWLSGHHEVPVYLTVASLAFWLFLIAKTRRAAIAAGLAGIFTILVSAYQLIPAYEFAQLAKRWVGLPDPIGWKQAIPYYVHTNFSYTPASLVSILVAGKGKETDPFIGVLAASLAILGIVLLWRSTPWVRWCTVIGATALLFAMPVVNQLHGLLYSVLPMFAVARVPARILVLFGLVAAPLAAAGFDAIMKNRDSVWLRRIAVCAFAWCAIIGATYFMLRVTAQPMHDDRTVFSAVTAFAAGALLMAYRSASISGAALTACLIIGVFIELGNSAGYSFPNAAEKKPSAFRDLQATADIAAYLKKQPGPFRVEVNDSDVPANFGDWHEIETSQGFTAAVTSNILDVPWFKPHAQNMLGIQYAVSRKPTRADQVRVFQGTNGINVYRNPSAQPKAWIVHTIRKVDTHEQSAAAIDDNSFNAAVEAVSSEKLEVETCREGSAITFDTYETNAIKMHAIVACKGLLVLSDTWYPGWTATVDGTPAPIHEVNSALRGVAVPAGNHTIEMRYGPRSAIVGGTMTILGLLACAAVAWKSRQS